MIQLLAIIFAGVLISIPAFAQFYPEKTEQLVAPMDKAIEDSNAYYADVRKVGAEEEAKSQDARYNEMTQPVNEANDRHFDTTVNSSK